MEPESSDPEQLTHGLASNLVRCWSQCQAPIEFTPYPAAPTEAATVRCPRETERRSGPCPPTMDLALELLEGPRPHPCRERLSSDQGARA
jgi:hypothetical protein